MSDVPANDTRENTPEPVPSRRSFLTRAAAASAVVVPTLTLITTRKARAAGRNRLTGLNAELINEIMNDENQHVPIIQNLLNVTQTQEYFPTAAGLAAVEARHASWLNSLLSQSLVEDFAPVEAPIDQSIVLTRVAEFVTDPRSTFPSFDTTVVSDANNFFILDFILFLEYIEAKFYAINVPRFAVLT